MCRTIGDHPLRLRTDEQRGRHHHAGPDAVFFLPATESFQPSQPETRTPGSPRCEPRQYGSWSKTRFPSACASSFQAWGRLIGSCGVLSGAHVLVLEARGASRGNAVPGAKTRFPSACASGFQAGGRLIGSCGVLSGAHVLVLEARGASRGNGVRGHQRGFPQLALRASKQGTGPTWHKR